jgi:hypothetical protein
VDEIFLIFRGAVSSSFSKFAGCGSSGLGMVGEAIGCVPFSAFSSKTVSISFRISKKDQCSFYTAGKDQCTNIS